MKIVKVIKDKDYESVRTLALDIMVDELGYKVWEEYYRNLSFDNIKNNGVLYIVIDNDDNIIGSCGAYKATEIGTTVLTFFYIKKSYRRLGIGSNIYNEAVEWVKENNQTRIILDVYDDKYSDAYKFYINKGYKIIRQYDCYVTMELFI